MPRCGATFDENTVPSWTRGDLGVGSDYTLGAAPLLPRRGFAGEMLVDYCKAHRPAGYSVLITQH